MVPTCRVHFSFSALTRSFTGRQRVGTTIGETGGSRPRRGAYLWCHRTASFSRSRRSIGASRIWTQQVALLTSNRDVPNVSPRSQLGIRWFVPLHLHRFVGLQVGTATSLSRNFKGPRTPSDRGLTSSIGQEETVVVPGRSVPHHGLLEAGTKPFFSAFMYHPHNCGRSCPNMVE